MIGNGSNIYGSNIYGSLIYHEYIRVLLYDFEISIHDLDTGIILPDISWGLYRRDTSISLQGPIDENHILVDSGIDVDGLLQIELNDYALNNIRTDYYLKAWRTDAPDITTTSYIRYYPDDYILNDDKQPYYTNKSYLKGECNRGGSVTLERNRWQLIAIPVEFGYWDSITHSHVHDGTTVSKVKNYIIDQLEDVYAAPANTLIEVMNTYYGDANKFYNYVVGVTQDNSIHNFQLSYRDEGNLEYVGIWVKCISPVDIQITWGEI